MHTTYYAATQLHYLVKHILENHLQMGRWSNSEFLNNLTEMLNIRLLHFAIDRPTDRTIVSGVA